MKNTLSDRQRLELLDYLEARFEKHKHRHPSMSWEKVKAKLAENSSALLVLHEMERTGGEPDVVSFCKKTDEYSFVDCSVESPLGRRSICYDREGLDSRKDNKPENSAVDLAASMGVELLNEESYRELQKLGEFDCKSSSWLQTPAEIRRLGGAIFGDRRYGQVFVYHNGAQSYYAARAFRGMLTI